MNAEEYYWPKWRVCAHNVSGLPLLIRASVIIFAIVFKVQLSVIRLFVQCIKVK